MTRLPLLRVAIVAVAAVLVACAPVSAKTGRLTVPLDRANPAAGTTTIAYTLIPRHHRSTPARGTILFNPGGPGQAAIALAPVATRALAPLRKDHDLLLIDPRGTGRSDPIHCSREHDVGLAFGGRDALVRAIGTCGRELGPRAGMYGTVAVADDLEAVRAALGIRALDLWGESYGTYLMQAFAARHPEHVRSMVLSGAYPIDFDPWGRDRLAATRRAIRLICTRMHRCRGETVLNDLGRVAARLRRRPARTTAVFEGHRYPIVLDEGALSELVYAQGEPNQLRRIPRAVAAGRAGRLRPLLGLLTRARLARAAIIADPKVAAVFSITQNFATQCHDYPRVFSYADRAYARRAAYERALGALDRRQFRPFSPRGWTRAGFEAPDTCLDWPDDPTAKAPPAPSPPLADVPVLVLSGELDTNTPASAGRQVARQFERATWAEVANAGHTPTEMSLCARDLATRFVRSLIASPRACASPRR